MTPEVSSRKGAEFTVAAIDNSTKISIFVVGYTSTFFVHPYIISGGVPFWTRPSLERVRNSVPVGGVFLLPHSIWQKIHIYLLGVGEEQV